MHVIFEPGTSPVASRHPNHWAMTNGLNFLNLFSSNLLLKETVSYHNIATCLMQVMFVNHDTCYKDKIWKFIGLFYDCYSPSTELLRILWRNDCLTPIHHYWARSERRLMAISHDAVILHIPSFPVWNTEMIAPAQERSKNTMPAAQLRRRWCFRTQVHQKQIKRAIRCSRLIHYDMTHYSLF